MSNALTFSDWTGLAEAIGSVLAVGAGFAYVAYQNCSNANATADAAGRLARHSVDRVTERMEALIAPDRPIEFALRGARAAEMISVMREVDISQLPPHFIEPVASIRSAVFAINQRIDEILEHEGTRRGERRQRLYSAGRILLEAREELGKLAKLYPTDKRPKMSAAALSPEMQVFVLEAYNAQQKSA